MADAVLGHCFGRVTNHGRANYHVPVNADIPTNIDDKPDGCELPITPDKLV